MSAQLTGEATLPRSGVSTTSRAALRTRPLVQRILIRSWEYIPAVRIAILILRLLAVLVLAFVGIGQLSISNWWGLLSLAAAFAVVAFALWVFTTAAKGWPAR
jgi:hypothetical protein